LHQHLSEDITHKITLPISLKDHYYQGFDKPETKQVKLHCKPFACEIKADRPGITNIVYDPLLVQATGTPPYFVVKTYNYKEIRVALYAIL
jgi:hypothetical protein